MYAPKTNDFLRKDQVSNFGRLERIDGSAWTAMVDVDIDEQHCWTLTFDQQQISAQTLTPDESLITSKVMAKIEVGSGNGVSEQILDVTDLVQLTIAGDHVKVSLRLFSAIEIEPPPNGVIYEGIAQPAPAPTGDSALVSCFLSAEFVIAPPPAVDFPVTPIFGAPGALTALGALALVSRVPVRVRRYSAFNPSNNVLFLNLRSSGIVAETNNPITLMHTMVLPPNLPVDIDFAFRGATLPFPRGLVWDVTTNPDGSNQVAVGVRVNLELVRQPRVILVKDVKPTS